MSFGKKITPYYEFNLSSVKKNYSNWLELCTENGRNDMPAYSIKANYEKNILKTIRKLGGTFEVCSYYEYQYLRKLNIPSKNIIVNGTAFSKKNLKKILKSKALLIADSEKIIKDICELNIKCNIGIRCNLDYIKTDENIFMNKISRFGIANIEKIISFLLKYKKVNLICLQAHFSGNTREPVIFKLIANALCEIILQYNLKSISSIDIGGGYKISKKYWTIEEYYKSVLNILKEKQMEHLKIIFEPGNSIIRDCGKYCTSIIDIKNINGTRYCIVDGSSIQMPFLKGKMHKYYRILNSESKKEKKQCIVGSTCKESDIISEFTNESALKIGSLIEFYYVGAYSINEIPNFIIKKPKIYYLK